MNISLEGKTAVIGGSTQGIGLAIAKEFAEAGATCILLARNETSLKEVVSQLATSHQQKHQYRIADFSKTEEVRAAIESIVQLSLVHILVNNTGGPKPGPITEATDSAFTDAFSQHIICNQILVKSVLPSMKSAAYGRIINIVSTSVRIPINNLGVSNTIRGATASWAKTLSNEVAQFGITVNNILPGFTETARLESMITGISQNRGVSKESVRDDLKAEIPARRFGNVEEQAAVAVFLASPAASYVNGVSIPVDGGRTGSI